ncbi:MAG: HAD family hydrolase [Tannerellaceae bacterium]|jgi:putative hydrolase of the HAD superfamily|nr:HAD family hydrolase [Tannerellaceae bacterium]
MFDAGKIKGIIFDYGGTIDSNGVHWAEVIRMAYEALQIPVGKERFREAYVSGERRLATNRIVLPHHNFWHVLRLKAEAQLQYLVENQDLPDDKNLLVRYATGIADWCYAGAQTSINAARPVLKKLSEQYPLFLVTNFYGNIEAVLKDFYLREFFSAVIESAIVGIRKPDPAIFRLGVEQSGFAPGEIAVVGDSYDKDILPATAAGCQTIWLQKTAWNPYTGNETAGHIITDFAELRDIFPIKS